MACRLAGAKPLSEPKLINWTNFSETLINIYIFIKENAFENVVC